MKTISLLCLCLLLSSLVYASGQIDISYAGYTISQPGSYIVVNDLHAAVDQNAITIETSDVTLDLNGHVLYGAGSTSGFLDGYGIYAFIENNISVKNGVVRDFRWTGILVNGNNNQVCNMKSIGNGNDGINIGPYGLVLNNIASNNVNDGIDADDSVVIQSNSVYRNGGDGIRGLYGSTITGNTAYDNGDDGIQANSGTVIGNSCYSNDDDGILASPYCSTILNNTLRLNAGDGIEVASDCQVFGNTCQSNTGAGIRATSSDNSIYKNSCTDNGTGLLSSTASNYFEQNKLSGNTIDESLGGSTEGAGVLANVIF